MRMKSSRRDKNKPPRSLKPSTSLRVNSVPSNPKLMPLPSSLNYQESVERTPSLPSFNSPQPSQLRNSKTSKRKSLNWDPPLNNPSLMTKKLKPKPKSTSNKSSSNSLNKETTYKLKEPMPKTVWLKSKTNWVLKRRERKMLLRNYMLPPLVKSKRKLNVKHGELNMPEILSTEPTKSRSSDKLRKS